MSKLRDWEFSERWQERWADWMKPGGHGAMADVRNEKLAWTPLTKPLSDCTVALVTTGGVHRRNQEPFDVMKHDGDWSLREIPWDTPTKDLTITHTHYNHLDADQDINCMFPIERLPELQGDGVIGGVAATPLRHDGAGCPTRPRPFAIRCRRLLRAPRSRVSTSPCSPLADPSAIGPWD